LDADVPETGSGMPELGEFSVRQIWPPRYLTAKLIITDITMPHLIVLASMLRLARVLGPFRRFNLAHP
jgi:hypothetical protein